MLLFDLLLIIRGSGKFHTSRKIELSTACRFSLQGGMLCYLRPSRRWRAALSGRVICQRVDGMVDGPVVEALGVRADALEPEAEPLRDLPAAGVLHAALDLDALEPQALEGEAHEGAAGQRH